LARVNPCPFVCWWREVFGWVEERPGLKPVLFWGRFSGLKAAAPSVKSNGKNRSRFPAGMERKKNNSNGQYGDLSTAAQKRASGRDDNIWGEGGKEQRQRQLQIPTEWKGKERKASATATATANTGISPLRRQSAPPSVEMTEIWVRLGRARQKQRQIPSGNGKRETSATAKAEADSLWEWKKKSNDKGRSWCDMDGNAWNCPASNNKSGLECLPSNIMAAESV